MEERASVYAERYDMALTENKALMQQVKEYNDRFADFQDTLKKSNEMFTVLKNDTKATRAKERVRSILVFLQSVCRLSDSSVSPFPWPKHQSIFGQVVYILYHSVSKIWYILYIYDILLLKLYSLLLCSSDSPAALLLRCCVCVIKEYVQLINVFLNMSLCHVAHPIRRLVRCTSIGSDVQELLEKNVSLQQQYEKVGMMLLRTTEESTSQKESIAKLTLANERLQSLCRALQVRSQPAISIWIASLQLWFIYHVMYRCLCNSDDTLVIICADLVGYESFILVSVSYCCTIWQINFPLL